MKTHLSARTSHLMLSTAFLPVTKVRASVPQAPAGACLPDCSKSNGGLCFSSMAKSRKRLFQIQS